VENLQKTLTRIGSLAQEKGEIEHKRRKESARKKRLFYLALSTSASFVTLEQEKGEIENKRERANERVKYKEKKEGEYRSNFCLGFLVFGQASSVSNNHDKQQHSQSFHRFCCFSSQIS
jgi:hypothetical protein